jgi:hypothetical protein
VISAAREGDRKIRQARTGPDHRPTLSGVCRYVPFWTQHRYPIVMDKARLYQR